MSLNFTDTIPYDYRHMFAIPHTEKHNYNVKKKFSNIFTSILARTILAHMVLKVTITPVAFTISIPTHRIAKSHFHIT